MSEPGENMPDGVGRFSPRGTIDTVIRRGGPEKRGLRPYIEALAYARWQGWEKLELEQYVKLTVLLDQETRPLDDDVAERLCQEITRTGTREEIEVVLDVLMRALERMSVDSPSVGDYVRAFESRMVEGGTAWRTRALVGDFLTRLVRLDPERGRQCRERLTRQLADWTLDYHGSDALEEFDVRSRGIFGAILAAAWADNSVENVRSGLDGAFHCALDKLMQACRLEWFVPFLEHLAGELRPARMYHRLAPGTLYTLSETLNATRRRVYERSAGAALAITTLEEAVHRPHRRQLRSSSLRLELELPGVRGFGEGIRLRVFDISRDGCLAVTGGPARFEETAPPREYRLDRGPGREYAVRRLTGVLQQPDIGDFTVRPGTELILHDVSGNDHEWAAIDGASIVRFTPDERDRRLWLGFHFDKVVPEVRQELENLVYEAV